MSSFHSKAKIPTITYCGSCKLCNNCISPKIIPAGKGNRKILIVTEKPSAEEDANNNHNGSANKFLKTCLKRLGVDLYKDCIITNAVLCHNTQNIIEDNIINACRPSLMKTIQEHNPNVIVLLGPAALKSLLATTYKDKDDVGFVDKWNGFAIPCKSPNAWIIAAHSPTYVLKLNKDLVSLFFKQALKLAISKSKSKPNSCINYEKQVELILNPLHAVKKINDITSTGKIIAFDYETNCLKPEEKHSRIVSCSICRDGKETVAFPWTNNDIKNAMIPLLKSDIYKVACNMKFEDRWTNNKLGFHARNWLWDVMLAAHVLNNSRGITGLKFQAFTSLGVEPYDEHIHPYLVSTKTNPINKIDEIDLKELLLYNGLDSLLTYLLFQKQVKAFERYKR